MNVKKALFASSLFLCGVGVLPVTAGLPVAHDESEISSPMPEQQKKKRTLTGNVTDGFTGEPLIGVSIMLKGSSDAFRFPSRHSWNFLISAIKNKC